MALALVVPAYRPSATFPALVARLAALPFSDVVIVDDGSGPAYAELFDACARQPAVTVLRHAVNLGKGAALKTAIRHVLAACPDAAGVVTADADGQHSPEDIARVATRFEEAPASLVLGSRRLGRGVPWRSRFGNWVMRRLVRVLIGHDLQDTQTGLRAIPRPMLAHLLDIASSGYEFELDMLIAAKHHGCVIEEVEIRTIYEPGNPSSHFNPLFDSLRVVFVLFRFTLLALATAALDNLIFLVAFAATGRIALSQLAARGGAILLNYPVARRAVFLSREPHPALLSRYLLLVAASGVASYTLIFLFRSWFGWRVAAAKVAAELLLFLVNFVIQREFVFRRRDTGEATDWDRYYRHTPFTARLTRRYTAAVLTSALRRFAGHRVRAIVEFGGANSCFLDDVFRHLDPGVYHVIDSNEYGLELLRDRAQADPRVRLHRGDVLSLDWDLGADAAFSVGLVEHFDPAGTRRAIENHFRVLRPGGYALVSAPTPTWLYRAARAVVATLGLWRFPDERPLPAAELRAAFAGLGDIVFEKVLWPLVFTQRLLVVRKFSAP